MSRELNVLNFILIQCLAVLPHSLNRTYVCQMLFDLPNLPWLVPSESESNDDLQVLVDSVDTVLSDI